MYRRIFVFVRFRPAEIAFYRVAREKEKIMESFESCEANFKF